MRLARLTSLLLACLACAPASALASDVIVVGDDGSARHVDDPLLPPPEATDPTGGAAYCAADGHAARTLPPLGADVRAARTTVKSALASARKDGSIGNDDYARYRDDYSNARATLRRLGGTERGEQKAVVDTIESIAGRKLLTASRMPSLFLTLRRNTEYWGSSKPLPVTPPPTGDPKKRPCTGDAGQGGARVTFEGDPVIFQWYRGRGLQIQQLANFGQANGLYQRCKDPTPDPARPCDRNALKLNLDRLAELASNRGGFKTWEYYFAFGGGAPPWTSGLSQGTAIQAFARGYELLGDDRYKQVGREALGAFEKPPPVGIRVASNGGSHYLIYSMSPGLRVLNGFLQATTGLYDFANLTGDSKARRLFQAGDRAARREIPRFDTGAWSLYSLGGRESDLGYHRLVRDFLDNLCDRTKVGVYCKTAKKFTDYQHQRPVVKVVTPKRSKAKKQVLVRFSVSKISCTKVTVVRNPAPLPPEPPDQYVEDPPPEAPPADPVSGGVTPSASPQTVYSRQIVFSRGGHAVQWTPRKKGKYAATVEAIDLNNHRVRVEVRFEVK